MGKRRTSTKKESGKPAPEVGTDTALKPKHELFCRYYAQHGETFGNATMSYAEAYEYDLDSLSREAIYGATDDGDDDTSTVIEESPYDKACHVCAVEGGKLLRKPEIRTRITELLNELLKNEIVDAELAKLIIQDTEPAAKIASIREYNKLRGRIIDKTQDVSRLPFGESDLSAVIATLPEERQDYFYGIIRQLIEEAELQRRADSSEGGDAR